MPLAQGDIVAVHHNLNLFLQYQPPKFGNVENATGIDVLWEDGNFTPGIVAGNSLDVIHDPSVATADLEGKLVRVNVGLGATPTTNLQPSAAFDGIVISTFRRQQNGDGVPSYDRALVRLLSSGAYLETYVMVGTLQVVTRLDDR